MLTRTISSVIGLPIMVFFVVLGGLPLLTGVFFLSVIGMWEIYHAISKRQTQVHYLAYLFMAIYCILIPNFTNIHVNINFIFAAGAFFIILLLMLLVVFHTKINVIDCAVALFGLFYIGFLMSFIYLVRAHSYGQYLVWLIFISAWGCDTGAYFVGSFMGKHKLTPTLSPKKTVEGAIGGIIGAGTLACIYGLVISKAFVISEINIIALCIIVSSIGAIFAQFGDLAASAIKRYTNIKDYGRLIPGHGGVMDRFDSVLFTAPITYIVMILILN